MNRPYVICHMLTSVDGKIDGSFMNASECADSFAEHGRLRKEFDCSATLYGTTTMLGFSDGLAENIPHCENKNPHEDFQAPNDIKNYIVSVDPKGTLGFNSCYIEKKNRPKAHIVEVLLETVSDDYLAYLRNAGVSYIFAGKDSLNCELMLEKLYKLFGIGRLLAAGGGLMNWSLVGENLVDELSIVIAPAADGSPSAASIFEKADFLPEREPAVFQIKDVRKIGDAVHLLYTLKR